MAIQHRDSAILSTSGEIASAVRTAAQLHAKPAAYDEPGDLLLQRRRDPGAWRGQMRVGAPPKEPPYLGVRYRLKSQSLRDTS